MSREKKYSGKNFLILLLLGFVPIQLKAQDTKKFECEYYIKKYDLNFESE